MSLVTITAPKDGFLLSIAVSLGESVTKAHLLATFDDDQERIALARVDFHIACTTSLAERLSTDVVGQRLDLIAKSIAAAEERLAAETDLGANGLDRQAHGIDVAPSDFVSAFTSIADDAGKLAALRLQKQLLPAVTELKRNENAETMKVLAAHRADILARISNLSVLAPSPGRIETILVGAGSFVELGDPIITLRSVVAKA
jgi:multidrug resistance efflux pump